MSMHHCVNLDPQPSEIDDRLMAKYLEKGVPHDVAKKTTQTSPEESKRKLEFKEPIVHEPVFFQASKALGKFMLTAEPVSRLIL